MQCSRYLNSHRKWRQISVENTAVAARKITDDGLKSQAAVASEIAGKLYGLKVLAPAINHNKDNVTRFIILAPRAVYCEGAGKISLCFEAPHKSGSLYNMLGNFIYNQVNMLRIESRPIEGRSWGVPVFCRRGRFPSGRGGAERPERDCRGGGIHADSGNLLTALPQTEME